MRAILLALVLFYAAVPTGEEAATPSLVRIGEVLPEVTMRGLNGPSRRLSEFHGSALIINVWASWCGPCRAEMASLERLAWTEGVRGFSVIGISTDDYPERAKAFLDQSNATISHFIDFRLQMEHMLGASRIPLTVLVDAEGRVIDKIHGARAWDGPDALKLIGSAFRERNERPAIVAPSDH